MKNYKVFMIIVALCFIANIYLAKSYNNLYEIGYPNVFFQKAIITTNLGIGNTHRFFIISFLNNLIIYLMVAGVVTVVLNYLKPRPDIYD